MSFKVIHFKVIYFGVIEDPLCGYIAKYNNCSLRGEVSEDMAGEISENRHFRGPHALSFEAPSPANPSEYPHKPYFTRISDPLATLLSLIVWVYLHSIFLWWAPNPKDMRVMQQSA